MNFNLKLFNTTETELKAIAALASIGFNSSPFIGNKTPAAVIAVSAQKEAKGEYGEKKGYGDQNAEPWFFHGNLPPGLTRGGKAVIISPSLYTTFHRRTSPVKKY